MSGANGTTVVVFSIVLFSLFFLSLEIPKQETQIIFCDVGQGDAILVRTGSTQVLIDGGAGNGVLECVARYMPVWDRRIELTISTHPDKDHIEGLIPVIERYETPFVMLEWLEKETTEFEALKDLLSRKASLGTTHIIAPHQNQLLQLGTDLQATVLWPSWREESEFKPTQETTETSLWDVTGQNLLENQQIDNYNDRSIVLLFDVYSTRVLLTGDLENGGEQALIAQGMTQDVDILKVAHHGSKTSSTAQFLYEVLPETAVISAGKKNSYGHPSPEVMRRLSEVGARVYSTAEYGDVIISFSQKGYLVKTSAQ